MLRFFILCCSILYFFQVLAQSRGIELAGVVVDLETKEPMDQANIAIEGILYRGTVTDEQGRFSIQVDSLPVTLIISSIGFETQKVFVENTETLLIKCQKYSNELPEILVSATPKVDTVYPEPYNVIDYVFRDDYLILLVYKNVFEKYELFLLDAQEQYVAHLPLADYLPVSLFKACNEDIYVTTTNGVYLIESDEKTIQLGPWIEQQKYDQIIRPCVLALDDLYFYQRYFYQGQALRYFGLKEGAGTDSISVLPMIEYEANIIRLVEETGNRMPRSGDFWDDRVTERFRGMREGSYALVGQLAMFFPRLYAPIVKKDSIICLFNHFSSTIQFFNKNGLQLREVPIRYHKMKRWKKYILYDEFTQEVYTAFHTRWGEYICRIDLETGTLSDAVPLDLAFIEKVTIRNGVLYFLHRNPYQGARNRMIQRVNLF